MDFRKTIAVIGSPIGARELIEAVGLNPDHALGVRRHADHGFGERHSSNDFVKG